MKYLGNLLRRGSIDYISNAIITLNQDFLNMLTNHLPIHILFISLLHSNAHLITAVRNMYEGFWVIFGVAIELQVHGVRKR